MVAELTQEQKDAIAYRKQRAARALENVLNSVDNLSPLAQQRVTDAAMRIIRIAQKEQELGPFALSLAGAQMAYDIEHMETPTDDTPRLILPGELH